MAVEIDGERNVIQMFNDAIGWSDEDNVAEDMKEQAEEIADDARTRAPGRLTQGIEVLKDTEFEPQAVIRFKDDYFYGQFPEYGTDEQREQAFVRGSAFGSKDEIPDEIKNSLEDALE